MAQDLFNDLDHQILHRHVISNDEVSMSGQLVILQVVADVYDHSSIDN